MISLDLIPKDPSYQRIHHTMATDDKIRHLQIVRGILWKYVDMWFTQPPSDSARQLRSALVIIGDWIECDFAPGIKLGECGFTLANFFTVITSPNGLQGASLSFTQAIVDRLLIKNHLMAFFARIKSHPEVIDVIEKVDV